MKQCIFKVVDTDSRNTYQIYADGSISGFPKNCYIVNYHWGIVTRLHAIILMLKKKRKPCNLQGNEEAIADVAQTEDLA